MNLVSVRSRVVVRSMPFILTTLMATLMMTLLASSPAMANCTLHGSPAEGVQSVALPEKAGAGPDKEAAPVLDAPFVKLAVLTLRKGTVLPSHDAPVPVTIMALSGSGIVKMGDKSLPLDPGHMVVLPPKVAHEVVPTAGTDLIVLVHYLKASACATCQGAPAKGDDAEKSAHDHGAKH